jgi:hypothetical protein
MTGLLAGILAQETLGVNSTSEAQLCQLVWGYSTVPIVPFCAEVLEIANGSETEAAALNHYQATDFAWRCQNYFPDRFQYQHHDPNLLLSLHHHWVRPLAKHPNGTDR